MEIFETQGTCSKAIHFQIEDGKIIDVDFVKGCPGSLFAIKELVKGQPVEEIINRLKGITCGLKNTSCPDQLAKALQEYLDRES